MRFALYARKSSENEDRQVQSIEDQVRVLRDLAQSRGLNVVEEITESHSAKSPGSRPEFDRLLKKVERGQADGILCWNLNRLSRNPIDSGKLSWMLQTGVLKCIQTPDKPYLPEDNVLLFSVETGMANQYILDLRKAVKRGMDSKLEKGWFPHKAPEGYTNNLRDHTIDVDPERFLLLQRAWRLLAAGTHTIGGVISILNDEWGYRTRPAFKSGGNKLSRTAGYRLFTNVFYTGYFNHAGAVYKGRHQPMISLDEFQQVQRRLQGQVGKAHRRRHTFAYTGLIRCVRCGHAITAEVQSGHLGRGAWTYYHCSNLAKTCNKRSIREDVLEARLNACLKQVTIVPEFKEIVLAGLEKWIQEEFGSQETQFAQQTCTLADNERMLNELLELRLRQIIDNTQYRSKQAELQETVNKMRLEIGWLQERLDRTRQTIADALDFRLNAREHFLIGDMEKRREIAHCLGIRYVFDEGDIYIEMNPLLTYVLPASKASRPFEASRAYAKAGAIEPLTSGSGSTKKTFSCEKVPVGWGGGTQSGYPDYTDSDWKALWELFRQVADGKLGFYAASPPSP